MPIDLVIDERDTKSGDGLGDNNNNSSSNGSGGPGGAGMGGGNGGTSNGGGRGGSADTGHHSDSASTPDHQVCTFLSNQFLFSLSLSDFFSLYFLSLPHLCLNINCFLHCFLHCFPNLSFAPVLHACINFLSIYKHIHSFTPPLFSPINRFSLNFLLSYHFFLSHFLLSSHFFLSHFLLSLFPLSTISTKEISSLCLMMFIHESFFLSSHLILSKNVPKINSVLFPSPSIHMVMDITATFDHQLDQREHQDHFHNNHRRSNQRTTILKPVSSTFSFLCRTFSFPSLLFLYFPLSLPFFSIFFFLFLFSLFFFFFLFLFSLFFFFFLSPFSPNFFYLKRSPFCTKIQFRV